jgi:DNA-directed RNA polymerase subunit beta'
MIEDVIAAMKALDLDKLHEEAMADVRSGKKTRRHAAVKRLRALDGLKRSGAGVEDLVVRRVPVIPAAFRPYTYAGGTFIPGDANELYSDLYKAVQGHKEIVSELGEEAGEDSARYLRSAVAAVYGYDDSPNPKIKARKVSGFLTKVLGSNPKTSWVSSKLIAKPQDFVGRGVITPDPELGMDEISVPADIMWTIADPHIQRRLVAQGIPTSRAMSLIKERHPTAQRVLEQVMKDIPVMYSRSPAWHKYNLSSGYAKLSKGDTIQVSNLVTSSSGADFDGDTMSIHMPSMPESIKDAKEKLLPSKMAFAIRNRDEAIQVPKHEHLLGLAGAQIVPSGKVHTVRTQEEALAGIKGGSIKLQDHVEIDPNYQDPMQGFGSQVLSTVGQS